MRALKSEETDFFIFAARSDLLAIGGPVYGEDFVVVAREIVFQFAGFDVPYF